MLWLTAGTAAAILLFAWLLAVVCAPFIGHIQDLAFWFKRYSTALFLWRLCIYVATGYGWMWMRRRLQAREPGADSRRRLLTAEIAAVITICLLESALLIERA